MNESSGSRKPRTSLARHARVILAITLLAYVANVLPWRDRLIANQQEWPGTILGAWEDDSIQFRFDTLPTANRIPEHEPAAVRVLLSNLEAAPLAIDGIVEVRPDRLWVLGTPPKNFVAGEFEWQPGLATAFTGIDPIGLFVALGALFLAIAATITRWWRLLAISGCATPWSRVFRISYYGLFLNLVVPGLAGSDVLRSVLVVRDNPDKRADAFLTVITDRVIGFFALLLLASIAIVAIGERAAALRLPVVLAVSALALAITFQQFPWSRRLLRIESMLPRLPQGKRLVKLDRALLGYAAHPFEMLIAIVLSFANHIFASVALLAILLALGDSLGFRDSVCVLTITNTLSALPITPGGWGVGEAAYGSLFHMLGGSATIGVATSITFRLVMMSLGLLGGIFVLLPGGAEARSALKAPSLADLRS